MTVDDIDKSLVELLMKNARRSSGELAKELNVSAATVRRRIERLLEEKVIRIVASLDAASLGFPVTAFIGFNVSRNRVNTVLKALGKLPQIRWIAATTGLFNIMALVWIESTGELFKFIEREIGSIDGITHSETFINLHIEKRG